MDQTKFITRLLIALTCLMVSTTDGYVQARCLIVNFADETKAVFDLSDSPTISFDSGNLIIESDDHIVEAEISKVMNFEFIYKEVSSVEDIPSIPKYRYSGNMLIFSGLQYGTSIIIHSMYGHIIDHLDVPESGTVEVDLSRMNKGIYIFSYGKVSFKTAI